ncbi:hypothetical protein [Caballeronia sp. LZ043]|uniref:hypothetical protein n=1 Tax=Caballeronia sp. LZ043 TaxID=3038569 RepID=UPI002865E15A|nr:hypothetical protein [Caballeronia sp. LZ043]MDR5825846.1 hypothetical protein [Caballeronia sp. LZ043]
MNCKPGDLAYIVVPADWPIKTVDGHVVEVVHLHPTYSAQASDRRPTWWCRFPTPWLNSNGALVSQAYVMDSWLRPISGVPVNDEEPADVNMPEAFQLALGIEMRAWA